MTTMNMPKVPNPEEAETASSGRERRRHHRRATQGLWADIDGERCTVRDLSLGGLSIQPPQAYRAVGQEVRGELCHSSGGTTLRSDLHATIVRVDDESGFVGAAFEAMEGEQIDAVLSMLAAIERDYVASREAEERRLRFRKTLRRITIVGAVLLAGVAGGFALWTMS